MITVNYFSKKGKSGDTLRDLFSRLKEASKTKKTRIAVPYSRLNAAVLFKFYSKGIVANYVYVAGLNVFEVTLKYDFNGNGLLDSLEWISAISRRVSFKNKFLYKLDEKHFYLFANEHGLFFFDELSNTTCGGEFLCKILC